MKHIIERSPLWTAVFMVGFVWGCQTNDSEPPKPSEERVVLARVDGEPIYQRELKASAQEALGVVGDAMLANGHEEKLLKGLVTRKAMAQLRWKEMTPKEQSETARRVAVFRERLLAKSYVEEHASDLELTDEEVLAYYEKHSDRFGASEFKMFEVLGTDFNQSGPQRARRLDRMGALANVEDWRAQAGQPELRGWLTWKKGDVELGTLHPQLRQTISAMKPGDISNVLMIGDKAYIVRVNGIKTRVAKPLSEVRGKIEKTLQPRAYRDAVEALKDEVLKQVTIEYGSP